MRYFKLCSVCTYIIQVDEVKGVMRDNVSRLLDREAQLDNLSERSEQVNTTLYYNI